MGELINGRTPEEIKTALKVCPEDINDCPLCPYTLSFTCRDNVMLDALALIERLESERDAALAKVPKWISMEERLPPPETKIYLIASHSPDGEKIVKTSVWAWDEIGEKGDWINWNVVTHWMPLPEPPKEEEK